MFVTEAIVTIILNRFEQFDEAQPWPKRADFIDSLWGTIQKLQHYHQLFHSIQWNRSRKKIKEDLESQLYELAQQVHREIDLFGQMLNQHTAGQIQDVAGFNQLVQLTQEARMLVEIHHLSSSISPVTEEKRQSVNKGCIPGLEMF